MESLVLPWKQPRNQTEASRACPMSFSEDGRGGAKTGKGERGRKNVNKLLLKRGKPSS